MMQQMSNTSSRGGVPSVAGAGSRVVKRPSRIAAIGAILAAFAAPTLTASAQPTPTAPARASALVARVVDGDSIDALIAGTTYCVRYIGIDAPDRGDKFYREATEANRRLVERLIVHLERDRSDTDGAPSPCLLRYVYRQDDGLFVNAELIRLGYARAVRTPPDIRHADLFSRLQQEATRACVGIWTPLCAFLPFVSRSVRSP